MPRVESIEVPLFGPDDPYHYHYDNIPFKNLLRRQRLINSALDDVIDQTRDAIGTQGTIANRLNQSINSDGSIKSDAIDETLHSIESHTDTEDYVRMQKAESDKLSLIASGATNTSISVQTDDDGDEVTLFDAGLMKLVPSTSVEWEVVEPNIVKAHLGFPVSAAHQHYYDQEPVVSEDPTIYYVNSLESPSFITGTLRVFINGMRLSEIPLYVPGATPEDAWTLLSYVPDSEDGSFTLSSSLSEDDVIRVDYDVTFI